VEDVLDALALLADERRLRVAAAVVLEGGTADDVAARAGVPKRAALNALTRLEAGGLVTRDGAQWRFDVPHLQHLVRDARPRQEPDEVGDVDRETAAVLRTFRRGGRLTQVPVQRSKRLVLLDHICRVFEIGVRYPEREVNAYLRVFHPDVAALRRYLVDEGFLTREKNIYWRTGGGVDV
jgi:hypothetical protein